MTPMRDISTAYVRHDLFMTLFQICDTTQPPYNSMVIRYDVCDDAHVRHGYCKRATRLCDMCDMTHSPYQSMVVRHDVRKDAHLWHDYCICAIWRIHECVVSKWVMLHVATWHVAIRLIRTCDMTHSYVRHDSFVRATWHFPQTTAW